MSTPEAGKLRPASHIGLVYGLHISTGPRRLLGLVLYGKRPENGIFCCLQIFYLLAIFLKSPLWYKITLGMHGSKPTCISLDVGTIKCVGLHDGMTKLWLKIIQIECQALVTHSSIVCPPLNNACRHVKINTQQQTASDYTSTADNLKIYSRHFSCT